MKQLNRVASETSLMCVCVCANYRKYVEAGLPDQRRQRWFIQMDVTVQWGPHFM